MYNVDEDGFIEQRRLTDQRRISVQPWSFGGATLGIGMKPPLQDVGVYDDSWNYQRAEDALKALNAWNPEESPEPDGWSRHVTTGRYRINGDVNLEYIKDVDGDVNKSIIAAIKATQGADRVIIEIKEEGNAKPDIQSFLVTSESSKCDHNPRCQWFDLVYHRLDRCVVVAYKDLPRISLANVLRRLTE